MMLVRATTKRKWSSSNHQFFQGELIDFGRLEVSIDKLGFGGRAFTGFLPHLLLQRCSGIRKWDLLGCVRSIVGKRCRNWIPKRWLATKDTLQKWSGTKPIYQVIQDVVNSELFFILEALFLNKALGDFRQWLPSSRYLHAASMTLPAANVGKPQAQVKPVACLVITGS